MPDGRRAIAGATVPPAEFAPFRGTAATKGISATKWNSPLAGHLRLRAGQPGSTCGLPKLGTRFRLPSPALGLGLGLGLGEHRTWSLGSWATRCRRGFGTRAIPFIGRLDLKSSFAVTCGVLGTGGHCSVESVGSSLWRIELGTTGCTTTSRPRTLGRNHGREKPDSRGSLAPSVFSFGRPTPAARLHPA
jgi:hypothetical protein